MMPITHRLASVAAVLVIGAPEVTAQPEGVRPTFSSDFTGGRAIGKHADRIPASIVGTLLATARRIGFFELQDRYHSPITDLPMTIVTITAEGRTKRIEDYWAAPKELKQLEAEIDKAAGTQRWIGPPMPPGGYDRPPIK